MSASSLRPFLLLGGFIIGAASLRSTALPEDVLAERRLAWRGRPAVSADGRFVAYTIFDPLPSGTPGDLGEFTPSGVPASIAGSRLFLTTVSSAHVVEVRLDGCIECTIWSPSWSPDSKKVAFYSDAAGAVGLWIYDLSTSRAMRLGQQRVRIKLFSDDGPIWSPDGQELYTLLATPPETRRGDTESDVPNVRVLRSGLEAARTAVPGNAAVQALAQRQRESLGGSIAAIDARTGNHRLLVSASDETAPADMKLSGSGRWIAYLSVPLPKGPLDDAFTSYSSLSTVSTSDQRRHVIDRDVQPVLTGSEVYSAAYLWRPDREQLVYQKNGKWWTVEVENARRPRPLADAIDKLAVYRRNIPAFTRDGRFLLFLTQGEERRLQLLPLDGGPAQVLQLGGAWDGYDGPVLAPADTLWQPDIRSFHVAMVNEQLGDASINRVDLPTGAMTSVWRHHGSLELADVPQQAPEPIGIFEDFMTPRDLYAFNGLFSTRRRLTTVNPEQGPPRASLDTLRVNVPGHDGGRWNSRTTLISPRRDRADAPPPAVVVIYPGSDTLRPTRLYSGGRQASLPVRYFTSQGYAVLLAEAILSPEGSAGHFSRDVTDAVLAQVYAASDRGDIDSTRLALIGSSYGGFATLSVIASTNLFRAAVAISSAAVDPIGAWGRIDSSGVVFAPWIEQRALMAAPPWADLNRYVANSPFLQADRIHTPLLLVHGEGDVSFPAEESAKIFAALNRLGRTAQLATYPGQGHSITDWSRSSASDALERISDFLSRHLTK